MANIGTFKKTGNDYHGEIVTVMLQKKNVTIVAEEPSENENAPTHRVFVAKAEIGAAWAKTSKEDRDFYINHYGVDSSRLHGDRYLGDAIFGEDNFGGGSGRWFE